ncbi:sigma 54-interacting transcriptional regulator [Nannocystis sp.]|uniref:sigma 54-interacting transcriptional regulator n=1 Tax=Nannocystis sp. TaxID=1962667 RepID=UPI0025F84725|nr:sigma 54-interacting transcriptional regulator [Nannocystis sp.]MBK7829955.1 sigma 54-interacting transcriptional regulator [Nannocystis sp.]
MPGEKLTLDGPTLGVLDNRSGAAPPAEPRDRQYLMVFHGEVSTSFALPHTGSVLIGRSDEAHLRIDDHGVSRRHAMLTIDQGEARLADLGSHNGVWVNDDRIAASRLLLSGDTVTIGGATLVYHAGGTAPRHRRALDFPQLRLRLAEEVERAARFAHELTIVVLQPGNDGDRIAVEAAVARLARRGDIVGIDISGGTVVLLPETDAATALAGKLPRSGAARIGYAGYPLDGSDPDALLAGARAAAAQATPGSPLAAGAACETRRVGEVEVIVADPAMQRLFAFVERIAAADLPVLITGETGTGKELVAAAIHAMSSRSAGPFMVMHCVALSEQQLESELFGRGADASGPERPGGLERAAGGTLFLDEIGELSLAAQARLLRALETRRVVRVGEQGERAIDLRIVAATNHAIDEAVQAGRFRRDLYFRLTGAKLWLPPLRDRPRELPILAQRFLAAARREAGAPPMTIAPAAMRRLAEHPWPGNVRELRHAMAGIAAAYPDEVLRPHHLIEWLGGPAPTDPASPGDSSPNNSDDEPPKFRPLEDEIRELEIQRISAALAATGGNQTRAAELIGMPLRTFVNKLKRHAIGSDRRS